VEADQRSGELQITAQPQFEILGEPAEDRSSDAVDQKQAASSCKSATSFPSTSLQGQGRLTARWFRRIIRHASKTSADPG
jgi:hypothetical protein